MCILCIFVYNVNLLFMNDCVVCVVYIYLFVRSLCIEYLYIFFFDVCVIFGDDCDFVLIFYVCISYGLFMIVGYM